MTTVAQFTLETHKAHFRSKHISGSEPWHLSVYCVCSLSCLNPRIKFFSAWHEDTFEKGFIQKLNTQLTRPVAGLSDVSQAVLSGQLASQSLSLRGPDRKTGAGHMQDSNSAFPGLIYHSLASNLKARCLSRKKTSFETTPHDQETITKLQPSPEGSLRAASQGFRRQQAHLCPCLGWVWG